MGTDALQEFGEFFRSVRLASGQSLREFCHENGLDPGNISKLERGLLAPPKSREILETYAKALGLEKSSDDWFQFFDSAALCNGHIPVDFLNDSELISKLPIVFRTLRGQKVDEEKLEELADLIRRT
ncbi:MAG: helix-turn-helix domain-containing protein [Desulfuromonadales bacterium]|nr:helix-turn-helix domain-containing protein [Desulfuromonadales bacterium]